MQKKIKFIAIDQFGLKARLQFQPPCRFNDFPFLRACLKIAYFAQFRCWLKNLILKILNVFLRLNFSTALNFNKLSNFQTGSPKVMARY